MKREMLSASAPIVISLVICAFTLNPASALSEPAAIGGMDTVIPTGASDTGRNPSLLPFSDTPISIFAAGSYLAYDRSNADISTRVTGATYSFKMKRENDRTFSASTAVSFRGDSHGFGIMFGPSDGSLYSRYLNRNRQSTVPDDLSYTSSGSETEISTKRNPALTIGWGVKTGDNSAFGIKITGGMIEETTERNDANLYNGTGSTSRRKDVKRDIFGKCIIGFLYRQDGVEGGFMFSSGRHGRRTQKYSFSMSSPAATGSDKVTEKYLMTEAPGFSMGTSAPVTPALKWIIELTYLLPSSYSADTLDYDWNTKAIVTKNMETETRYSFAGRFGLRYEASPRLIFTAGLAGLSSQVKENADSVNHHMKYRVDALNIGAGADFILSKSVTLGFAVNGLFVRWTMRSDETGSSMKIRMHEFNGTVQTGATCRL